MRLPGVPGCCSRSGRSRSPLAGVLRRTVCRRVGFRDAPQEPHAERVDGPRHVTEDDHPGVGAAQQCHIAAAAPRAAVVRPGLPNVSPAAK